MVVVEPWKEGYKGVLQDFYYDYRKKLPQLPLQHQKGSLIA